MLFYNDDALFATPPLVTDGGFPRAKLRRPVGLSGLRYTRGLCHSRGLRYLAGRGGSGAIGYPIELDYLVGAN